MLSLERRIKNTFNFGLIISLVALVVAAIYGWINNIVIIYNTVSDPITGEFVLRCLGVAIAPLGAIMGWL